MSPSRDSYRSLPHSDALQESRLLQAVDESIVEEFFGVRVLRGGKFLLVHLGELGLDRRAAHVGFISQ